MPAPAAKKRLTLGPVSGWLPAAIAFLCLALVAMAALVLIDVNADPEDPQSSRPTAVSAQGFAGLRRMLEAEGHSTALNRMEDGEDVTRGDLEIITMESQTRLLFALPQQGDDESANASDATGDDDEDDETGESSSSAAPDPAALDDGFNADPDKSHHILYSPLGRAVLIVAPKWSATGAPQHPRWAAAPELVSDGFIRAMLLEMSPETKLPEKFDKTGNRIAPKAQPGQNLYDDGEGGVLYDKVPYVISRAAAGSVVLHAADGSRTMDVGKIHSLQSITAPNLQPVLVDAAGRPILSRLIVTGGRKQTTVPVYLLSDPDLLNNQILADAQKVASGLALVDDVAPKTAKPYSVVFNLTFNGASFHHDLFHALSRPPYLAVPLSLLVLALGLMWAAFARFGPARQVPVEPPLGRGVRILADNAARLMAITLKEAKLGTAYAQLVRDRVLKDKGYLTLNSQQSPDDLAEQIGRRHNTTNSYLDLRDRAARIATVHQLIDVTRLLHDWKTEIQRAHI